MSFPPTVKKAQVRNQYHSQNDDPLRKLEARFSRMNSDMMNWSGNRNFFALIDQFYTNIRTSNGEPARNNAARGAITIDDRCSRSNLPQNHQQDRSPPARVRW